MQEDGSNAEAAEKARGKTNPMTNAQLYLAIGVPILFNGVLFTFVLLYMNPKFAAVDARFEAVYARFATVEVRFNAIDRRFDSLEKIWDEKLARVEGVMDARLKHLEER